MNLKQFGSHLRVNLFGPGPLLIKKNLPGRGLTKVEKHWPILFALRCKQKTNTQREHKEEFRNVNPGGT